MSRRLGPAERGRFHSPCLCWFALLALASETAGTTARPYRWSGDHRNGVCHAQEDSDDCWRRADRRRIGLFRVRSRCRWWWCRRRWSGRRCGWRRGCGRRRSGRWWRWNLLQGRRWTRRFKPSWIQKPDGSEFHRHHFLDEGSSSHTTRQTPLAIGSGASGLCSLEWTPTTSCDSLEKAAAARRLFLCGLPSAFRLARNAFDRTAG
jgi:hypothetical protein